MPSPSSSSSLAYSPPALILAYAYGFPALTNIVNLTPHAIAVYSADGATLLLSVQPSGNVARVTVSRAETARIGEIPVFASVVGAVTGLPEKADNTVYIVSALVRLAVTTRLDVFSPGELIRDANGQPIGCRGLDGNV